MKHKLQDLAKKLDCRVLGDCSVVVSGVASLQSASSEDLVFVEDAKCLDPALASAAGAVIAGAFAENAPARKPVLIATQPRLAFARAAKLLSDAANGAGTHPSAVVAASARIGNNVVIGAGAIVGENARIGDESSVGSGCVISDGVAIGKQCRLDANVTVYAGTTLGDRVVIQAGAVLGSEGFGYVRDAETGRYAQFPQIGSLAIEDDVEIGANSTIDRGALDETRVRRGTKIDNLVHIGHNVTIGCDVVIAAQVGLSGSVTVGDGVIMGGQVGIGDHAKVGPGSILGGQCGILPHKVVRDKGVLWGTPAKPLREYLRELAFLSRAARKQSS